MTLANKITYIRIFLAPVFYIIFLLPEKAVWTVPVLWSIFVISELSDMFDGMAARKQKEVSDIGKLFDPFADTFMQLTCFFCFAVAGIFPSFLFLLVIYREFSILFIRNLMLKKGITMGARMSGKVKTVSYIIAIGAALLVDSFQRLSLFENLIPAFKIITLIVFIVSVAISVISFIDYLIIYIKNQ